MFCCVFFFDYTKAPREGIQNSLGFWIPRHGFRILGPGFRILCQWNLDSGFQALVGFRIFFELYSGFQSPESRVLRQKFSGFRIPQAKMSRIPEYGFSYMERILVGRFRPRDSRVISFSVAVEIDLAVEISLVNPS